MKNVFVYQNFVTLLLPLLLTQRMRASLTDGGMNLWHQARAAVLWIRGTWGKT